MEALEISDGLAKCRTCGEVKPLTEFDIRADTGRRRTQCKACRRAYQLRRYLESAPPKTRCSRLAGTADLFRCIRCGEMKPASAFNARASGSAFLHSWCKACFSTYKAERHQLNHDREMRRINRNKMAAVAANRARLAAYVADHPCVDCGERDPIVLDFDHVRGPKVAEVSRLVASGIGWEKIAAEIAKCEVRCANDHRRVTHGRRQRRDGRSVRERRGVRYGGDPGAIRTPDPLLRRQML